MKEKTISEGKLLFLLGAVQFINIVDFMMVMPLGPDFGRALAIPSNRLGLLAGSYTAAAAISGLIAATFLDRFDRRRALFVAMLGLVSGTAAGGLAIGFRSLVAARVIAGIFGGPATAIAMSILTDAVPPERRGKAMGKVMGAFSVASVLGVPLGLRLAIIGDWRTPFFTVAGAGLVIAGTAVALMPPMRGHLRAAAAGAPPRPPSRPLGAFFSDRSVLLSLAATAVTMTGSFALILNLSPYIQFNLGYPREQIDRLYTAGGLVAFFTMRLAGYATDKRGSFQVAAVATALILSVMGLGFLQAPPLIPILSIYIGFMVANSARLVALNALTTRVPPLPERGRFMSISSAVQSLSGSLAAAIGSAMLSERPDHSLTGMTALTVVAMTMSVSLPVFVGALATRLRARAAAAGPAPVLPEPGPEAGAETAPAA